VEQLAGSRTEPKQTVERARMVLGCLDGKAVQTVACECHTRPNTVIKWRQRFAQQGLAGLSDAPRRGAKLVYGEDFRNRVLALLEEAPPAGQACWDGAALAGRLNGSVHAVWRVLRKEGICLQRQRSWCVSTDKEFAAKAADVVGLYLNPPANALVISVDEKPSIQALAALFHHICGSRFGSAAAADDLIFEPNQATPAGFLDSGTHSPLPPLLIRAGDSTPSPYPVRKAWATCAKMF
jgi:transposase